jgi:hypothetical protein
MYGVKRTAYLGLIAIAFAASLIGVVVRSERSPGGFSWPLFAVAFVGVVAWVWWRTVAVSSRNVSETVAEFGAVSGVYCRLVNDRVDQFGSLVVGHDGITWNPSERAVQAGCGVWRAATDEIVSVVTGRTSELLRRSPTVTVTTTTSRPLYVAMPAKAQRTFVAAASDLGLPTSSTD